MYRLVTRKKLLSSALLSIFWVVLIFVMHIWFIESTFNGYVADRGKLDLANIEGGYILHMTHPAFAMRPVTNMTILALYFLFDSFMSLGFLMVLFFGASMAGVGVLVYVLAKKLGSSSKTALLSQTIFFLSFSIFFAFATNMHTYDEPLQYIFIFASLVFLLRNNNYLFGLSFFIALLARETTILLVPALLYISYKSSYINFKQTFKTILVVSVLFLVYYGVWSLWGSSDRTNIDYLEEERFLEWRYSFQNWQFTKESFIMALAVLAPWIFVAYNSIKYNFFFRYTTTLSSWFYHRLYYQHPHFICCCSGAGSTYFCFANHFLVAARGRIFTLVCSGVQESYTEYFIPS